MLKFVLFAALVSLSTARMAYQLADAYDEILTAPLQATFSCEGLPYGYYADQDNNCEIFHICLPISDELGALRDTAHFSFFCGNQTIFDQESLTCNHKEDAFPCDQAKTLYELSNADFGKIPEKDQRKITFPDEEQDFQGEGFQGEDVNEEHLDLPEFGFENSK